jgi:predicted anti-sigma-YlaC factor YlaD
MTRHLDDDQITAAVAGLEIEQVLQEHLSSCVACRRAVHEMGQLIGERRQRLSQQAPDWQEQHRRIIDRLATTTEVTPRARWRRPVFAIAATALIAIALAWLWRSSEPDTLPLAEELQVEQVLADVDAILADDSIPGLWPADPMTDTDDLEALIANGSSWVGDPGGET